MCSIHMKESGKNDGCLRNGLVTEDRPTHAYGDESQQLLPWHDVEVPTKTKKTSGGEGKGKGTRKCSNCGESGHNKKTCPLLKCETVEDKVEDDGKGVGVHLLEEKDETEEKEVEQVKVEQVKVEKKEKVGDVISTVRAALTEVVKAVEATTTDDELDSGVHDVQLNQGETIFLEDKVESQETEVESPKTEPPFDMEMDVDDSGDGGTVMFEGIEYTLDAEEGMVYDDELAEVGTWDGTTVDFANAASAKLHRIRKLGLKQD
jgi:hypothetical protein